MNDEPWLVRTISVGSGTRTAEFRESVRQRDRRCVISGEQVILDFWDIFEAAHIFPLAYEGHWKQFNYGRWITMPPATASAGTINSVQNGMLLEAGIHKLFDNYGISINPDVRIVLGVYEIPLTNRFRITIRLCSSSQTQRESPVIV